MRYSTFLALALTATVSAQASDWPQWRGPYFNGSTDEEGLPSKWSKTENIAWSVDLPGAAAATPIVWENRVFLSGVDVAKDTLQAMCFDRTDGELLWNHDLAKGIRQDTRSNYASPSPVTDGKLAIFFYGNGDLVCFDFDGGRRWARNIQRDYGPLAFFWAFGGSPLLVDGKLYLQVLQRDVPVEGRGLKDRENESYLLALDPNTGKTLWRKIRSSQAVAEARESHTTPIPMLHEGQTQLLIAGGDALSGHDPASGRELWRWAAWNPRRAPNWPLIASPVAGSGVALVCVPKREPIYSIKAGGSGVLDDRAVAWASREAEAVTSEVPTPAYYDGDFFVLSDSRKCLSRVEPRTGKVKWTVGTPGRSKYEASPLAADGKIYLINSGGQVAVISAADGGVHHLIPMDEPAGGEVVRASMIAAHGQLFIRTTRKLYCVGKGQ
ncbi:MAG: PQQ-binding-like beta-propeller repeat protein [Planctomycetes bacterium]|nr:PQQ-binding-like beta-propeller repeat protein [Planctomycetota bacterium]